MNIMKKKIQNKIFFHEIDPKESIKCEESLNQEKCEDQLYFSIGEPIYRINKFVEKFKNYL
jgi:hypothetical protein